MATTDEDQVVRLGDRFAYPSLDIAAKWSSKPFKLTDASWRHITRPPRHTSALWVDPFANTVTPLRGRCLEADSLQVLDEYSRIAKRKAWTVRTLTDKAWMASAMAHRHPDDPEEPPIAWIVSDWITASLECIGEYIRRHRNRVGQCVKALEGIVEVQRWRCGKSGRMKQRVRIVLPLDLVRGNIRAWEIRSEEKAARRNAARERPATTPAQMHEKHEELAQIDHGDTRPELAASAPRQGRGGNDPPMRERTDSAGPWRMVDRNGHEHDEFTVVTKSGFDEDWDDERIEREERFIVELAKGIGLAPDWIEKAIKHNPLDLRASVQLSHKGSVRNPAGYAVDEYRRRQEKALRERDRWIEKHTRLAAMEAAQRRSTADTDPRAVSMADLRGTWD